MKLIQLHVRDLFWLVLVVGLILGWWLDHRRLALYVPAHMELMRKFSAVIEALGDEGGTVYIDKMYQVSISKEAMGKERWDAHLSRIDQEVADLPPIEISGPSSP